MNHGGSPAEPLNRWTIDTISASPKLAGIMSGPRQPKANVDGDNSRVLCARITALGWLIGRSSLQDVHGISRNVPVCSGLANGRPQSDPRDQDCRSVCMCRAISLMHHVSLLRTSQAPPNVCNAGTLDVSTPFMPELV